MSQHRDACAGLMLVVAGSLLAAPAIGARRASPQDPPQGIFRSGAAAVAVDVTVRDRSRREVTGLTARDFQVFDNGVLQQIDDLSYGKLPIDITVALDVSYSVTGALLDRLRQGVVQLMGDLGKQDRLRLVLFNMRVTRTTDYTSDVKLVERAIRDAKAGGGTALLDAVSVTLVSAAAPDRRQLIVFFTDGSDSSSTTSPAMLTAVAQRTRATLTFVMPTLAPRPIVLPGVRPGTTVVTSISGLAPRGPLDALFRTLATETGGSVLATGPGTNLSSTFRQVLNEFRSTYVLYYTARGVDRSGYHTIQVKVSREGAQVQARRGYFSS